MKYLYEITYVTNKNNFLVEKPTYINLEMILCSKSTIILIFCQIGLQTGHKLSWKRINLAILTKKMVPFQRLTTIELTCKSPKCYFGQYFNKNQ